MLFPLVRQLCRLVHEVVCWSRRVVRRVREVLRRAWDWLRTSVSELGQNLARKVRQLQRRLQSRRHETTREQVMACLQELVAELEALPEAA